MKTKLIIAAFCCLTCNTLQAAKMSSYSINGAATHVVVTQSKNGSDLVYFGSIDGQLSPIDAINELVTQGYTIATPSLTYDARTIFFAAKTSANADFNLYTSYFLNGNWSKPSLLNAMINSPHDELSPSLSADGQTLYFIRQVAADKKVKHSKATSTIFFSHIDKNGRYSIPASVLFSTGEEYSVAILPDNITLLFTSYCPIEGSRPKVPHLYYSKYLLNNNWYDPIMIPLDAEQHFIPSSPTYNARTHNIHYLATTTDRKSITTHKQITTPTTDFVSPLHHIQGYVRSTENDKPMAANITISDIMTNAKLYAKVHNDGFYALTLPHGYNAVIDFTAPKCSHQYMRVDTRNLTEDKYETFNCSLSNQIELTFMLYDGFILEPISANLYITDFNNQPYNNITIEKLNETSYRTILPLGEAYRLRFKKEGYLSNTIDLAANREIQFNRSQLDIELSPLTKKAYFEVVDAITKKRIEAEIEIKNVQLPEYIYFSSLESALVDTILRYSASYVMNITARGYLYKYLTIDMQNIANNHVFMIELDPLKQGTTVQLSDVNFEYDSAELMPTSIPSLLQVLRLLETNPEICIELAAHTDDRGNEQYNLELSQQRATSVLNYLVENGIASTRLKAVGYGKSKPLFPNTSDTNRAKNRRVEFIVL